MLLALCIIVALVGIVILTLLFIRGCAINNARLDAECRREGSRRA